MKVWRGDGVFLTTGAMVFGISIGCEIMGVVSVGLVSIGGGVMGELRFIMTSAPQHLLYLTCPMIDRIRLPTLAIIAVMTMGSLIYYQVFYIKNYYNK